MPETGPPQRPEWARREQASDLRWLSENLPFFWLAAQTGFEINGRGAVVTDATTVIQSPRGEHQVIAYLPRAELEKNQLKNASRMVKTYDPDREFVAVLLKTGYRESTYRLLVPPEYQRIHVTKQ